MSNNFLDQSAMDASDPQWAEIFKNLQGNILKPHGRHYCTMIFIKFQENNMTVARNVIGRFSQLYVTSFAAQLQESARFKSSKIEKDTFGSVFISSQGYAALGAKPMLKDAASMRVIHARRALLKDAVTNTAAGYQQDVHAMLMLADDNLTRMNMKAADVIDWLEGSATVAHVEYENAIRNAHSVGSGYNGDVDSCCQPLCVAEGVGEYITTPAVQRRTGLSNNVGTSVPMETPGMLLVHDPYVADGISFGSYFVFNKQDEQRRASRVQEAYMGAAQYAEDQVGQQAAGRSAGRIEHGKSISVQSDHQFPEPGRYTADSSIAAVADYSVKQGLQEKACHYFFAPSISYLRLLGR